MRVLYSRNVAYAKLRENKIVAEWRNHSLTDMGKSCLSREFLASQTLFTKIKFSRKFPNLLLSNV